MFHACSLYVFMVSVSFTHISLCFQCSPRYSPFVLSGIFTPIIVVFIGFSSCSPFVLSDYFTLSSHVPIMFRSNETIYHHTSFISLCFQCLIWFGTPPAMLGLSPMGLPRASTACDWRKFRGTTYPLARCLGWTIYPLGPSRSAALSLGGDRKGNCYG